MSPNRRSDGAWVVRSLGISGTVPAPPADARPHQQSVGQVRSDTVCVRGHATYNDDPNLADVPLSTQEAEFLAANPQLVRKKAVQHLLLRALATTRQLHATRMSYDEELRRRTASLPKPAAHAPLSPEQAARFLSPAQLERLFDRFSRDRLAALDGMRQRAQGEYDRHRQAVQELDHLLLTAINDPQLPEQLREQLQDLRDRITGPDKTEGGTP